MAARHGPWSRNGGGMLTACSCGQRSASSSSSTQYAFPSHLSKPSPYDIFHLPRTSSAAEVKARYYDLVKILHPDRRLDHLKHRDSRSRSAESHAADAAASPARNGRETENGIEDKVKEEFRLVVAAYELLTDHKRRAAYDRWGLGWDSGPTSSRNPFGASDAEWQELRRRSAFGPGGYTGPHGWSGHRGHDFTGWQREAGSGSSFYAQSAGPRQGSDFSFHSHPPPGAGGPRYASNQRFIAGVAIITWTLALFQFHRLSHQSSQAVAVADKRHLDAVKNLQEARGRARSFEGRERLEALRRRAREDKAVRDLEQTEVGDHAVPRIVQAAHTGVDSGSDPVVAGSWGIGHGGPSGREHHDRRWREDDERRAARSGA
ncbi:unnamed protein product [Parajaminaea phylloscopi]